MNTKTDKIEKLSKTLLFPSSALKLKLSYEFSVFDIMMNFYVLITNMQKLNSLQVF